jgi:hypothetical protein
MLPPVFLSTKESQSKFNYKKQNVTTFYFRVEIWGTMISMGKS